MLELAKKNKCTNASEVYGGSLEHPQKETYLGHVNYFGIRNCYDERKISAETFY